jgi:hypothetical protein
MAVSPSTYSLGDFREVDRRGKATFLIVLLAITVGLSIEAAVITAASLSTIAVGGLSTTASRVLVANLVLAGILIVFAGLNLPVYLPGADEVTVDGRGITLVYRRGWEQHLRWDNPRTRLALLDYSSHGRMVRQRRSYHLYVPYVRGSWFLNRKTVIDGNVFDAILGSASSAGADVQVSKGSSVRFGLSPVIHRVTGVVPPSR